MARYEVSAPAVQVVVESRSHFLERGAILPESVEADVIERFLAEGLIVEAVEPEEVPPGADASSGVLFSQDDVESAVKAAEDAASAEIGRLTSELEAVKAELEAAKAKRTPAPKPTAAKQS